MTKEEFIEMLPDREIIHVFLNPVGILVGADWTKKEILELLEKSTDFGIAGELAQDMGHGIYIFDVNRYMFIETKKVEDKKEVE